MQKIIKTFLVLAAIFVPGGILCYLMAAATEDNDGSSPAHSFQQLAQGLFILTGVLLICATALLYKYGLGAPKEDTAK